MGRFGVAFLAAAAFALAVLQSASAADATSSPATETSPATTPAPAPAPEPAAATTQTEPAPAAPASTPAPESSTTEPSSTPTTGSAEAKTPDGGDPAPTASAPAETTTGTANPVEAKPETTLKDAVKLEEAPASTTTPAPAAPAPSVPAPAPPPPAAPPSGAPPPVAIILQNPAPAPAPAAATAPDTETAKPEAAKSEADDAAVAVVSLRPRPAPAAIELLPEADAETELKAVPKTLVVVPLRRPLVRPRTCLSPMARVALFDRCKRAYAVASLNITLTYLPSLPEVRAAIARGAPPRAIVRKVEARPPPKSKAAEKRPVAEVRPAVPFGHSGQGITNDGFSGSSGSASKSRLFAVTLALSPRVPPSSRFARQRVPSTLPHGVIPDPPSARPG